MSRCSQAALLNAASLLGPLPAAARSSAALWLRKMAPLLLCLQVNRATSPEVCARAFDRLVNSPPCGFSQNTLAARAAALKGVMDQARVLGLCCVTPPSVPCELCHPCTLQLQQLCQRDRQLRQPTAVPTLLPALWAPRWSAASFWRCQPLRQQHSALAQRCPPCSSSENSVVPQQPQP